MKRALLLASIFTLAGCGDDAPMPLGPTDGGFGDGGSGDAGPRLVDLLTLARQEGLLAFASTATTAGLEARLTGSGVHTAFAPTDMAFEAFAFDAPADPELLTNIAFNHVLVGAQSFESIAPGTRLGTLARTEVEVTAAAVGGARVSTERLASNGRLVILEDVIRVPPVGELDQARPDLAGFGARLRAASTLAQDPYFGPGPVTVFVPADAALEAFGTAASDDALLGAHLVPGGQRLAAELAPGQTLRFVDGSTVEVQMGAEGLELVDGALRARVLESNIRLANGVVHVISEVLTPRALDVLDVMEQEGLTTLRAAVRTANLEITLRGEGPFTVFAPTDAALEAVRRVLPGDPTLLANLLLTHVLPGRVRSSELGAEVTTAARTTLAVTNRGGLRIGAAAVSSRVDLEATNGVVHVLDEVIVPRTMLEELSRRPELSTLANIAGRGTRALPRQFLSRGGLILLAPSDRGLRGTATSTLTGAAVDAFFATHLGPPARTRAELENTRFRMRDGTQAAARLERGGGLSLLQPGRAPVPFATDGFDIRLRDGIIHVLDGVIEAR